MALYANGQGRYRAEYRKLWSSLVPASGQCDSLQGELVRVIGRLASEYYRNGNMNWENGYDKMLACLLQQFRDEPSFNAAQLLEIEQDGKYIRENALSGACPYQDGEDEYDRLTDRVVEWCNKRPRPIPLTVQLPYDF